MPRSGPLFPRLLFQIEAHLTSSPVFMTLFEDAHIRTSFSKSSLFPRRLTPSSLFPPSQVTFCPPIHRSASMAFPTTPFSCTPHADDLLLSARAPQSTNLILCQPLQKRHVVSRDRATWPNNLHESCNSSTFPSSPRHQQQRLLHPSPPPSPLPKFMHLHVSAQATSRPDNSDHIFPPSKHLLSLQSDFGFLPPYMISVTRFGFSIKIENPNSFMWNALIRACARSTDRNNMPLRFITECWSKEVLCQDKHTFPFVLKACAYLFALSEGEQIHAQILKLGFDSDVYINNSLVHFYATCDRLDFAKGGV
ncbi:Pentatricopeptide repeat-containing protein, chloroplastic/mitochondrial [Vitis vinifera]|uniref:Pentatricopeptide repeat-containing protein, chloroplastic/mitochondrial n=1 Tax=Vitis vinifera TaxID=29760 RepID=A0A438HD66_VITVI|nr:Pentatricopeptide repeat-containing protein, chloroplastic/mitochondrial [Vitis vinifera]